MAYLLARCDERPPVALICLNKPIDSTRAGLTWWYRPAVQAGAVSLPLVRRSGRSLDAVMTAHLSATRDEVPIPQLQRIVRRRCRKLAADTATVHGVVGFRWAINLEA